MSLIFDYYKTSLLSIRRGSNKGVISNAKPIFILTLIKSIEDGLIIGNKIDYSENLKELYLKQCVFFEPKIKPALFQKPFFHFAADSVYHIKWKSGELKNHAWHTPSEKFLRENVEYAYLDSGLWDLLQDQEARREIQQLIIDRFLSPMQ